jgi:hypothetical protein
MRAAGRVDPRVTFDESTTPLTDAPAEAVDFEFYGQGGWKHAGDASPMVRGDVTPADTNRYPP